MDMKIVIDAWLERNDPQIRFLDAETATTIMQWGSTLTRYLLERGELNLDELQQLTDAGLGALYDYLSAISTGWQRI